MDSGKLILIKEIGRGSYGEVYKAEWQPIYAPNKLVAAKKFKKKEEQLKMIPNEITRLASVQHSNIVSFIGTTVHSGRFVILMEYAECGSLSKFLHTDKRHASDVARLNWMLQVANALVYLHDRNICHRDLKPDNLVLTNNYKTIKLCDFGLVKELASNNSSGRGTISYMAPEITLSSKYTTMCDVFSFGIVLWEVMSNKKPFYDMDVCEYFLQKLINESECRPKISDVIPYDNFNHIKAIMQQCWEHEEQYRPTMKTVAFILGIDRHTVYPARIMHIKPLPSIKDDDFEV